jgi:hypothetical protein
MKQLQRIGAITLELAGHEYLYFDLGVCCPQSGFQAWAVSVSPSGGVHVMDSDEQWHPLEPTKFSMAFIEAMDKEMLRLQSRYGKKGKAA